MKASRYAPKSGVAKRRLVEPRHLIILACFLATLSAYVERVGFSIAYTAMAKVDKVDEATKGTVLSAFYWGYGVSQVSLQHKYAVYHSTVSLSQTTLTPAHLVPNYC